MRIGECADLCHDCLRNVGPDRWVIHVPLGKLKTERMVPVDSLVHELSNAYASSALSTALALMALLTFYSLLSTALRDVASTGFPIG